MSESNLTPGEEAPAALSPLLALWNRLPPDIRLNMENNFLPEDPRKKLLPNEEIQLEIGPAWYRDIVGQLVFHRTYWLLGAGILITVAVWLWVQIQGYALWLVAVPPVLFAVLAAYGIYEHIEHLQWRLVKTNARLIISIPVQRRWPLVDNIELRSLPTVLDTNWSRNPWWRIFQVFTGARDLYVSLVPFQFEERSAIVRGALIIPDVMPGDVWKLKQHVFKA